MTSFDASKRPDTLAEAAVRFLAHSPRLPLYHHVNEFLDEFYMRHGEDRIWMLADEPQSIDQRSDAWLGAVCEHLCIRWGLGEPPTWVDDPRRFLKRPWYVEDGTGIQPYLFMESPIAFRRRFIFTEEEPLRRARMPTSPSYDGDQR